MKGIKINSTVNLTNGLTVPAGSCLVINSFVCDNKRNLTPDLLITIFTSLYNTKADYNGGKTEITNIADFNTLFIGAVSVADYENLKTETLLIDFIIAVLTPIFTAANLSVINITPKG